MNKKAELEFKQLIKLGVDEPIARLIVMKKYHTESNETLFLLDCCAIINFLLRTYYISLYCSNMSQIIFLSSVIYSLISYFIGKYYRIMSFNPDWNTQMFYHSLMHLSTSYSSYVIIKEIIAQ
jgi:hypothetical protein